MKLKTMLMVLLVMLVSVGMLEAQAATRPVSVSWSASTSSSVTGYNIYRCVAPCTPSSTSTPLNTVLITTLTFTDNPNTTASYVYGVIAVAPACSGTSVNTVPCGNSAMGLSGTVPVPPTPASGGTIIVVVP